MVTNLHHILYPWEALYDQLLPTEILNRVNLEDFNLDNCFDDSPVGCFLAVDIDYPDEMHDLHKNYPLAGEKKNQQKNCCPDVNKKSEMITVYLLVKPKN